MSYDYEDYFGEPSEADEFFDTYKDKLRDELVKEVKDRIERLEKENAELTEVKTRMRQIESEHARIVRECEQVKADAERKAKQEHVDEILKGLAIPGWCIDSEYREQPKCDRCDDDRKIEYVSKYGDKIYEPCKCSERKLVYIVVSTSYFVSEVHAGKNYAYQMLKKNDDSDCWRSMERCGIDPEEYRFKNRYGVMFTTEEKAQAYCDWLNKERR